MIWRKCAWDLLSWSQPTFTLPRHQNTRMRRQATPWDYIFGLWLIFEISWYLWPGALYERWSMSKHARMRCRGSSGPGVLRYLVWFTALGFLSGECGLQLGIPTQCLARRISAVSYSWRVEVIISLWAYPQTDRLSTWWLQVWCCHL